MTSVALIDHGAGNLRSVEKALEAVGAKVKCTNRATDILEADKVVLPGVGAFADVMTRVRENDLVPVLAGVVEKQIPLLGICVGMQILFESSEEFGVSAGLGFLPGKVIRFDMPDLKIPQTGWNVLRQVKDSVLLRDVPPDSYAYFNHSYYCSPGNHTDVLAETDYGIQYASVVGRGRIYGVQFHPEKSQQVGLKILKNFIERA